MKGVVISLCDESGIFVKPWVESGYTAILVDPQHEKTGKGKDGIFRISQRIDQCLPALGKIIREQPISFVAGFPPCTDVSVSGARWWGDKFNKDRYFQAKAAIVAEQCRTIGELSGAKWFFENPVSGFSGIFGKPDYIFNPCDYTGYCSDDNYTKKTCLWTGGGFVMPEKNIDKTLPGPDNRIHKMPPSEERAILRSKTPEGFSIAVYEANS